MRSVPSFGSPILACAAVALAACGTSPGSTPDGGGVSLAPVTIAFEHRVTGATLALGTDTPWVNAAGNHFGVTRLAYFVSEVTITGKDGAKLAAPVAHYVDVEAPATAKWALPSGLPAGPLASISFVMGVSPALNQSGAFKSPPESLMEWPEMMGGGYHHMKLEGRYIDRNNQPFNFLCHSGGLDKVDYSFRVTLDLAGRSVPEAGATIPLQMEIAEWFTGPNTWDLNDYFNDAHRGIMSDAAAQASLKQNGAGVFSIGGGK